MFVMYVGVDKYVTMWIEKKERYMEVGWQQRIVSAHPYDSSHHIFTTVMFICITCTLSVHFPQLIMPLHNTFHAWIPCENSSWIYCTASAERWNCMALCELGNESSHSLYTNAPLLSFIYTGKMGPM